MSSAIGDTPFPPTQNIADLGHAYEVYYRVCDLHTGEAYAVVPRYASVTNSYHAAAKVAMDRATVDANGNHAKWKGSLRVETLEQRLLPSIPGAKVFYSRESVSCGIAHFDF